MLILLLCGVSLSEIFGAQRLQAVMNLEAAQSNWIAEAGLWHAAHEDIEITTPVAFAGGTYAVTRFGTKYTATGDLDQAESEAIRLMVLPEEPIEIDYSLATLDIDTSKKFTLDLYSIWPDDLVIAAFDLSDDSGSYEAHRFKLGGQDIWHEHGGVATPTGVTPLNKGTTAQRTITSFGSEQLLFQSHTEPSESVTYTLVLYFTTAPSATLVFTVAW